MLKSDMPDSIKYEVLEGLCKDDHETNTIDGFII